MELAAVQAEPVGFDEGLTATYPALARRLALVLHDSTEAEDVAQAAFARALEARGRFSGGDIRAWFFTIGLRLAFNELRRQKRARERSVAVAAPTWAAAVDLDLWSALADIDPQPRAALLLSVLDGYTHEEIGAILEVPSGTVGSWLSRTKERLRVALKEE